MKTSALLSFFSIACLLACNEQKPSALEFYNECFYQPKSMKEHCFAKTFNHICNSDFNPADTSWMETAKTWVLDHPESKENLESFRHEVVLSGSEETRKLLRSIDEVLGEN